MPFVLQECLFLEQGKETIFLRRRFGFVKMALQTGAHLVPAFAFGQSRMCVQNMCSGLPKNTRLHNGTTQQAQLTRRAC